MTARVGYLLGRIDRVLRRRLGEALAQHALSLPEYTTLSVLRERSGLSNAELARRSLITPQAMNEVVARLEERKLVRRRVAPEHRRIRPAELTAAGRTLLARADAATAPVERSLLAAVPARDREVVRKALIAALQALEHVD